MVLQFAKFEVIIIIVCLNEILNIINCLSLNLQSTTLDIKQCTLLVDATKQQILELRSDDKFFDLYEQSLIITHNSKIPTPSSENFSSSNRSRQNASTMTDYYVTINTGKRRVYSSEEIKTDQKRIFYNILDVICSEMNRRFNKKDTIYTTLEALDQTSTKFLDDEIICHYAETFPTYGSNEFITKLKIQCQLGKTLFSSGSDLFEFYQEVKKFKVGFEELTKIIEHILVVPVSSASAERSFSTMKRVKAYLRSTMTSRRLNNLTLLSIEREISGTFMDNPSDVIEEFASMKKRKLEFSL